MATFHKTLGAGALLCLSAPSWATSAMGTAEVKLLDDGRPCFAVPAKDAKRDPAARLQAVSVADDAEQSNRKMWAMHFRTVGGLPVSSFSCLAYGQVPEGGTSEPVSELRDGKAYYVSLNVKPSDRSDPTRGYYAKFCIVGAGAERRIKPIPESSPNWQTGRCE
ncbi:hypothetical protein PV762_18730 [Mitsuaria sp. CC2]|uniref:hypothetical protein n=1 Tax=Mitsuaria sp. CC2 TaxID=3029186 RepID=UPI003B8E4488